MFKSDPARTSMPKDIEKSAPARTAMLKNIEASIGSDEDNIHLFKDVMHCLRLGSDDAALEHLERVESMLKGRRCQPWEAKAKSWLPFLPKIIRHKITDWRETSKVDPVDEKTVQP